MRRSVSATMGHFCLLGAFICAVTFAQVETTHDRSTTGRPEDGADRKAAQLTGEELYAIKLKLDKSGEPPSDHEQTALFELNLRISQHAPLIRLLSKYLLTPEQVVQRLNLGHPRGANPQSVAWTLMGLNNRDKLYPELLALFKKSPKDKTLRSLTWGLWLTLIANRKDRDTLISKVASEWQTFSKAFYPSLKLRLDEAAQRVASLNDIVRTDSTGKFFIPADKLAAARKFTAEDTRPLDWYSKRAAAGDLIESKAVFLYGKLSDPEGTLATGLTTQFRAAGSTATNLPSGKRWNKFWNEHQVISDDLGVDVLIVSKSESDNGFEGNITKFAEQKGITVLRVTSSEDATQQLAEHAKRIGSTKPLRIGLAGHGNADTIRLGGHYHGDGTGHSDGGAERKPNKPENYLSTRSGHEAYGLRDFIDGLSRVRAPIKNVKLLGCNVGDGCLIHGGEGSLLDQIAEGVGRTNRDKGYFGAVTATGYNTKIYAWANPRSGKYYLLGEPNPLEISIASQQPDTYDRIAAVSFSR